MSESVSTLPATAVLPESLEQLISRRTFGQVAKLRVEERRDQIVVHGSAPSYYVKQLAMQAILESMARIPGLRVALNVQVGNK